MNTSNYLIIALFSVLLFFPIVAMAENSSVTEHGFFGVEQDKYILDYGDEFQIIKISGIGNMQQGDNRAKTVITITNPDSTQNSHRMFSNSDGYFELTFPLYYHSQTGVYKVFATFDKYVLGEIFFTVERLSITESGTRSNLSNEEEHVFTFKTSKFEVTTDSPSYEKNETIHIMGAVPTEPNRDLTLQIIDPMNNIILINQITPEPDGTFEDSINSASPLWKFEGEYTIRMNHNEQDLYSTFSFNIPTEISVPNPITSSQNKIKTILTLNNLQNTYRTSTSSVDIPISGYLTADGNGQAGADIHIIDNGVRLVKTLQTDSKGYFSGNLMYNNNKGYHEIQVIYDGTDYFELSKSQIKKFDIVTQSTSSQSTSSQSTSSLSQTASSSFDPTGIIVVVILSVMIGIAVIALKRRKPAGNKPQTSRATSTYSPPTNPNPPGNTESSTMFFYECPKCHGADIQNNPDGSVSCPDCGFRG